MSRERCVTCIFEEEFRIQKSEFRIQNQDVRLERVRERLGSPQEEQLCKRDPRLIEDHQIVDLVGVLNPSIHPPVVQNTQLNSDASAERLRLRS